MFVNILPPEVRSRIAAGEVIESPADVVKELLENSLDAGARNVEVEITKGGKRLIYVKDDGTGIHPEDIERVVLEGATSKIKDEKDLINLKSYGFRGEALHSIVSVSRLRIRSRYFQELEGYQVDFVGGELLRKSKVGMAPGTVVEVMDLFYNLPVRRKSLRREDTERNRVLEVIKEYAIVNPTVGFRLISNGREVLSLKQGDELSRIEEIFGERFEVYEKEREFLRVRSYIARNVRQGKIYIFINSRPVSSRSLKEFLKKVLGYKTMGIVFLELPSFMVDFNIHPKKREVRFLKERKTLSLLRELLSTREDHYVPFLSQGQDNYSTDFELIGQIDEKIILARREDYLYFFDQHLLSERINYEKMKDRPNAEDVSCRISIKAGERLSTKQMEELIEGWKNLENPHVCPHGRPIYYRVHLRDIYEKLGRSYY